MQDPFEIIAAPYDVYIAPVGTAFPALAATPSASWTLLGRLGAERYTEDGVTVQLNQSIVYVRTAKIGGPVKAARTEDEMTIGFTCVDQRPAQFTYALAGTSPTSSGGLNTISAYRHLDAAQFALLVRGDSPINVTGQAQKAQYEVPKCVQGSSPQIVHSKSGPASVAFEFHAVADPNSTEAERFGRLRVQVYPYEPAVMADAPSLFLRLGETSGTAAVDASGNGLNGVYQNTPTLGVTGALAHDPNPAVTLNGTDEYISVADNALLDPGDTFTLECWIKPSSVAGTNLTLLEKGADSYAVYLNNATIRLGKSSVDYIVDATVPVVVNVWTHVAATKSGSNVKLYLNGVDVTGSVANQTIVANASPINIGRSTSGVSYYAGSIDEVAIYPTALSAARVLAHYQAGL